ncbi:MAG: hypothetical protein BGO95_09250 [Micrococcales bacterium 73-13]|nr:MAG: hypothetical protein BGO95_09250 [Micrococcales bacterium 73-13]
MAAPRVSDLPRIRVALGFYRVSAAVTGVFLLLLVVMMVTRYGFGLDLELGGPDGLVSLAPKEIIEADAAVNLSTIILIVHGWLYVVYLICDFALWRFVRYSFGYFCFVALGGIIPFISFYFEWRVPRDIRAWTAAVAEPASDGEPAGDEAPAGSGVPS